MIGADFKAAQPVHDAWVGGVGPTFAQVKARCEAGTLKLVYSTSSTLSSPTTVIGTLGEDDVFTFTMLGLTSDTEYFFGFAGSPMRGKFRTFPTGAASFTIAAGSCAGNGGAEYPGGQPQTSNSIAFERIMELDPMLFVHMGDLHYRDLDTTDESLYRAAYKDVLSAPRFSKLVRRVPTVYIFDDHDFGPNDSDGTYAGKAVAQQVYREHVPHWTLADDGDEAIYQSFAIGRVRFIFIDPRSGRSPNSDPDDASKSRLGATQKAWLKDELAAATEPCIVLFIASWWGDTTGFSDGWESFSTEREELAEWFTDNDVHDRLLLVGGDIHELMEDDGTNTQFDSGNPNPGPPYVGFAPLDATYNDFSATAQNVYQISHQQFGTIEFVDTGSQITVTAKGWACVAQSYDASVLDLSDLVAYWRLDDLTDSDGSNDLTAVGTPTVADSLLTGDDDGAREFPGADTDYYQTPTLAALGADYSLIGWIIPDVDDSGIFLSGGASRPYIRHQNSDITVAFTNSSGSQVTFSSSGDMAPIGSPVMVAFTHDGSEGVLYINGVEASSEPTASQAPGALSFRIGRWGAAGLPFDGTVDEIAIVDRALTPAEVAELYERGTTAPAVAETEVFSLEKVYLG